MKSKLKPSDKIKETCYAVIVGGWKDHRYFAVRDDLTPLLFTTRAAAERWRGHLPCSKIVRVKLEEL